MSAHKYPLSVSTCSSGFALCSPSGRYSALSHPHLHHSPHQQRTSKKPEEVPNRGPIFEEVPNRCGGRKSGEGQEPKQQDDEADGNDQRTTLSYDSSSGYSGLPDPYGR